MTDTELDSVNVHLDRVKRQLLLWGLAAVGLVVITNGAAISYGLWQGGRWVEAVEQRRASDRERLLVVENELQRRQNVVDQFRVMQGAVQTDRDHFIATLNDLREELRALRRERDGG